MGTRLDDINPQQEGLLHALANRSLTDGGLAIHGSNTENVLTANAVTYLINGIFHSKGAQTEIDISGLTFLDEDGEDSEVTAQEDDKERIYLLCLDTSGNIRVVEGDDVDVGETVPWPKCPPEHAPFGAIKVKNETGSDFTLGTTDLDTANVTDTYYDLSVVPAATSP